MTLKDKIEMQAQDTTQVYLHQEGIFYKVFNEGAFLLNYLIKRGQLNGDN